MPQREGPGGMAKPAELGEQGRQGQADGAGAASPTAVWGLREPGLDRTPGVSSLRLAEMALVLVL